MQFVPSPNFIVVSISKTKQKEKKEKVGSLYVVTDDKDESRNMQQGTIVALGVNVTNLFPQAKVGHTLLLHWLVESKQKNNKFFEDEENNYYLATATECNGRPNESYAVWDGENLIPNPEYIFLELAHTSKQLNVDEFIDKATKKSEGGILVFSEWKETRAEKEKRMAKINAEIESLTKTKMSPQLAQGIKAKENELAGISADINKSRIEFYKVAAINPDLAIELKNSFGHEVGSGDGVGMLNMATQTTVEFNGKEFVVALTKHLHCTEKWALDGVNNFKNKGDDKNKVAV